MTLNERICFQCRKSLDFNEFKRVNEMFSEEKINQLWNHPHLEFLCCDCYTEKIRHQVKEILSSEKKYQEALKFNSNPTVWRRLAIIYFAKVDYNRAEEAYKQVLKLDPSDKLSLNNLNHVYQKFLKKGDI